jgi:hypothetical protein
MLVHQMQCWYTNFGKLLNPTPQISVWRGVLNILCHREWRILKCVLRWRWGHVHVALTCGLIYRCKVVLGSLVDGVEHR